GLHAEEQKRRTRKKPKEREQGPQPRDSMAVEEDDHEADPGCDREGNENTLAGPEPVLPARSLLPQVGIDGVFGVVHPKECQPVQSRLNLEGTSHMGIVAEETVVVSKGILRSCEVKLAAADLKSWNHRGLERVSPEVLGNQLVDVDVNSKCAIPL